MINIRRDAIKNCEIPKRKCLLDYMLEISANNPHFTDDDIVNEACTFMLAGQDSVGAATAFCLFLLAQHPEYQQKCMDELYEIFEDDDRQPTMKDIREMRFLEQCIKETLRLYPYVMNLSIVKTPMRNQITNQMILSLFLTLSKF